MRVPKVRSYGAQPPVKARSYGTRPNLHNRAGTFASIYIYEKLLNIMLPSTSIHKGTH